MQYKRRCYIAEYDFSYPLALVLPIDEGEEEGDELSLSFVLSFHLKLKGREKIDDVLTCSLANCVYFASNWEALFIVET